MNDPDPALNHIKPNPDFWQNDGQGWNLQDVPVHFEQQLEPIFPVFPGWKNIGLDTEIIDGDKCVFHESHPAALATPKHYVGFFNPDTTAAYTAHVIGCVPRFRFPDDKNLKWVTFYRRSGPRFLPGNPHFQKPLPLP